MRPQPNPHPLDEARPPFLLTLDSDPEATMEAFFDYALRFLATYPPACFSRVSSAARDDMIQDLVLHCVLNDFRVLRKFDADRGSFAGWFRLVARNRARDWLDSHVNRWREVTGDEVDGWIEAHPLQSASAESETWAGEVLASVQKCLRQLSHACQLLIGGAAEGRSPRELAVLMGWGESGNKKASDDLRACRKRLRKALEAEGIDPAELAGLE